MHRSRVLPALLVALNTASSVLAQPTTSPSVSRTILSDSPRPRLVVVLCIDQFRADILTRYADLYLPPETEGHPGGFQYLMHAGAYYPNARYEHYPLVTAVGHAVVMTGGHPYKTGIIANEWWDPRDKRRVYAVEDPRWQVVGAAQGSRATPQGPALLRSTTVGDELKLATAGRAKVVSLALKDRPAILLGGHTQDVCLWFDAGGGGGGRWISSTAFAKSGDLPAWVKELNDAHIPDRSFGQTWTCSLPDDVVKARSIAPKFVFNRLPDGFEKQFPHHVPAEASTQAYTAFTITPAANAFVFETAAKAVAAEGLGQDEVPDILAISLSSNDHIGHVFGPNSPEALDIAVQTDRQLSTFLTTLSSSVPGGLSSVVFVLTGDHGVSPIPEDAAAFGFPAGRFKVADVLSTITTALTNRFGDPAGGSWFSVGGRPGSTPDPLRGGGFLDGQVWLSDEAIAAAISAGKSRTRRDIEQAACDAINSARIPGVYGCFGKLQILDGALPHNDLTDHLAKAIHPQISPDLIVLPEQVHLIDAGTEGNSTTHGTPYAYDAHVPVIICCPGLITPGVFLDRVAPSDIAPTLSLLLGTEFPSACDGQPLRRALGQ